MAPRSSSGLSPDGNITDVHSPFQAQQIRYRSGNGGTIASLLTSERNDPRRRLSKERFSREQSIHEAVVLSFGESLPDKCLILRNLSTREWRKLLEWLDISGLALYFLDRMTELRLSQFLPSAVIDRLERNLIDNSKRTSGMIAESVAIQRAFQEEGLSYAVLKGFSLCPTSVPRAELRHQFDLDFLIAERCVLDARKLLEQRGYRLYSISGRTWDFKINEMPGVPLKDIYKDLPGRSVELHVEAEGAGDLSLLRRTEALEFYGIAMPVLSPVDQFLGQGLHFYKDICSEFCRASHLLEFRRHVLARFDDAVFWDELRSVSKDNPRAWLGLGVATQLIAEVMGEFAPEALTKWTVGRLPALALKWIETYGKRAVFKKFPGDKLYLLLQREVESAGIPAKRPLRSVLIPLRLPPPLVKAATNEKLSLRIRRYCQRLGQILSRLHFHIVEGIRYAWESRRWQQVNRGVR